MNKALTKKEVVFGIIIVIYVLSQIAGTLAIRSFFLDSKKTELIPRIKYLADEIGNGNIPLPRNSDFILIAYGTDEEELDIFEDELFPELDIRDPALSNDLTA